MIKKTLVFLGFALFILSSFLSYQPVLADGDVIDDPLGISYGAATGLSAQDPRVVVGQIISVGLGLLGTISVVLMIYAGFLWMTAGGNDDQIDKAKGIISASVIGLVIILSAYGVTQYVLKQLYQATQAVPYGGV